MEKVIHRSESRGFADHGWLKTYHTFSFNTYYDPRRIHFGALRILNQVELDGGEGFGSHPHDNMEIITLPLEGALEYGDSMGNITTISKGDVHVMSAGTGVVHNEYNKSMTNPVRYLQIWIFPKEYELPPRYSQITFQHTHKDKLQSIVGPLGCPECGYAVACIHQSSWLYYAEMNEGAEITHTMHLPKNGSYIFVSKGSVTVEGTTLHEYDGMGIWAVDSLTIKAEEHSEIFLIEVPMFL